MLEWVRDGLRVDLGRPLATGKMAGNAGVGRCGGGCFHLVLSDFLEKWEAK